MDPYDPRRAPRPFYQRARRSHRLGFGIPTGMRYAATAWPWYNSPTKRGNWMRRRDYRMVVRSAARRRKFNRQCARAGYAKIGRGVWLNVAVDAVYALFDSGRLWQMGSYAEYQQDYGDPYGAADWQVAP